MCDSGKWETFSERSKKEQSARKISRCARNDSVGNGYPLYHTKSVWEMRSSRNVIPSEVEGSFSLAVRGSASDSGKRETPYRGKQYLRVPVKRLIFQFWKTQTILLLCRSSFFRFSPPVMPSVRSFSAAKTGSPCRATRKRSSSR